MARAAPRQPARRGERHQPLSLLDITGPRAQPEAVGEAGRHITQAWRESLEETLPRHQVAVDWDPRERVVTAFTLG
jgi:hypothetical protein